VRAGTGLLDGGVRGRVIDIMLTLEAILHSARTGKPVDIEATAAG